MSRVRRYQSKEFIINAVYFSFIFVAAFALSSLALYRKINAYNTNHGIMLLTVEKDEIAINSFVKGRVEAVEVKVGQHVNEGDTLMRISDEELARRLDVLNEFADTNLSANTEAQLLASRQELYTITAPKDGVIYQIHSAEGGSVNEDTPVITMFSDTGVKLITRVSHDEYNNLDKSAQYEVYSDRVEQTYKVEYEGVATVEGFDDNNAGLYRLVFSFSDGSVGPAFIDGESLKVVSVGKSDAQRPQEIIVNFWNRFLVGQ